MTTIALVGPGSVGTYIAAHLAAAGNDVIACARRPFTEYVIDSEEHPLRAPAHVATDPAQIPDGWTPRFVLVATKVHQTAGASAWLDRLVGPGTTVVSVQNGFEGPEVLAPLCAGAEVLGGVVYCGAELLEPGHVQHHTAGLLITPDVASAHELAAAGNEAFTVRPDARFVDEVWRKLGANVVANGITALTRRRMDVFAEPGVADLVRGLLSETYAVARAQGASLGDDDIERFVGAFAKRQPAAPGSGGGTSMLYDRLAGRPTEHDAIHGAVVRLGARHGIPTPLVHALDTLLGAGDTGAA